MTAPRNIARARPLRPIIRLSEPAAPAGRRRGVGVYWRRLLRPRSIGLAKPPFVPASPLTINLFVKFLFEGGANLIHRVAGAKMTFLQPLERVRSRHTREVVRRHVAPICERQLLPILLAAPIIGQRTPAELSSTPVVAPPRRRGVAPGAIEDAPARPERRRSRGGAAAAFEIRRAFARIEPPPSGHSLLADGSPLAPLSFQPPRRKRTSPGPMLPSRGPRVGSIAADQPLRFSAQRLLPVGRLPVARDPRTPAVALHRPAKAGLNPDPPAGGNGIRSRSAVALAWSAPPRPHEMAAQAINPASASSPVSLATGGERQVFGQALQTSQPPVPSVDRLVDEVIRRLERQFRSERLRRGL